MRIDVIPHYDYSVLITIFLRPYNGRVVKTVDYELSRGCIYACEYCVETVIQSYYGFDEVAQGTGTIRNSRKYLRHKSADKFSEMNQLHNELDRTFRCQDTIFLQ